MDLLGKVRTLAGALIHRPFTPRPEKADLDKGPNQPAEGATQEIRPALEKQEPAVADSERVADLIAQQRQDEIS
jgi:hypothetical protein